MSDAVRTWQQALDDAAGILDARDREREEAARIEAERAEEAALWAACPEPPQVGTCTTRDGETVWRAKANDGPVRDHPLREEAIRLWKAAWVERERSRRQRQIAKRYGVPVAGPHTARFFETHGGRLEAANAKSNLAVGDQIELWLPAFVEPYRPSFVLARVEAIVPAFVEPYRPSFVLARVEAIDQDVVRGREVVADGAACFLTPLAEEGRSWRRVAAKPVTRSPLVTLLEPPTP